MVRSCFVTSCLFALLGCTAPVEGSGEDLGRLGDLQQDSASQQTPDDVQRARAILEGYGLAHEHSQVEIVGDRVRLDGDVLFTLEPLLDGAYDEGFQNLPADGSELVEKGYFNGGTINASNIFLAVFGMPQGNMFPLTWAMGTWNNGTNTDIYFTTDPSGAISRWVSVVTVSAEDWDQTQCPGLSACVWHQSAAAAILFVRERPWGVSCDWTFGALAALLIHELGHVLALTHPGDRTYIQGTEPCTEFLSNGSCDQEDPGYATVMKGELPMTGCNLSDGSLLFLQPDDVDSVNAIY